MNDSIRVFTAISFASIVSPMMTPAFSKSGSKPSRSKVVQNTVIRYLPLVFLAACSSPPDTVSPPDDADAGHPAAGMATVLPSAGGAPSSGGSSPGGASSTGGSGGAGGEADAGPGGCRDNRDCLIGLSCVTTIVDGPSRKTGPRVCARSCFVNLNTYNQPIEGCGFCIYATLRGGEPLLGCELPRDGSSLQGVCADKSNGCTSFTIAP